VAKRQSAGGENAAQGDHVLSNVLLSSGARSTLLSLSSIQNDMNEIQKRLSTGKKVGSPLDNPTAYFLAASLTSRATTLSGLNDNISLAQNAVTAANNGIAAIQSLLSSAQAIANSALQSPQSLASVSGDNSAALTAGSVIATTGGSGTRFKAGDVVTVSDGTTTATYIAANNDTVQAFLDTVNNTANLNVTASLNSDGQITLSATSNVDVAIGATMNGAGGATLNSVIGLNTGTTSYQVNTIRQSMATQFASLRTQIDAAAQDASYSGINLLASSTLNVSFNETGTSSMTLNGVSLSSSSLGVTAATNNWQLDSDITASIDQLESAVTSLQNYSATFGSNSVVMGARADFNHAMITTLQTGADDLTANDPNEDGAMLLALQTRQQIATTALSLLQSSQSSILRLFGNT
jgi:flagellin-like hook-associated protein FlgL